jgi:hypothetical protein
MCAGEDDDVQEMMLSRTMYEKSSNLEWDLSM